MMKVYIVNPSTHKLTTVEEWAKEKDPKAARLVAIAYENGNVLYISKNKAEKDMEWPEAMKYAEAFTTPEINIPFRAPSRREALDMTDAKDLGIMEALDLIGGNALSPDWYWTNERISHWLAARCNADNAWLYGGYGGYIRGNDFYDALTVVPVALYSPSVYEKIARG